MPPKRHVPTPSALGSQNVLLGLLALVASLPCLGSHPYRPVQPNPLVEAWRRQEINAVTRYRDHQMAADGSTWFATRFGVIKYDGQRWETMTRTDDPRFDDIFGIHLLGGKTPFVQTPSAILRYTGESWEEAFSQASSHQSNELMTEDRWGNLWAGTRQGLVRIAPDGTVRQFLSKRIILNLHLAADGSLWFATEAGFVVRCRLSEEGVVPMENDQTKLFERLPNGEQISLESSPQGDIWAAASSYASHLMHRDPETGQWNQVQVPEPVRVRDYSDLLYDSHGRLWVAEQARLLCWDGAEWSTFAAPDFPIPYSHYWLAETPDGALWIAARGSMPLRIDAYSGQWTTYENLLYQGTALSGEQWFIANTRELVRRDPAGHWTAYGIADGVIEHPVTVVLHSGGAVWVLGSENNVAAMSRFHNGRWEKFSFPKFAPWIERISPLELSDGRIVMAGGFPPDPNQEFKGGLLYIRNGSTDIPDFQRVTPPQVPFRVISIAEGTGDDLIFAEPHLKRFDGQTTTDIEDYPWRAFMPGNLRVASTPDGTLWVSHHSQGVARRQDGRWTTFSSRDGLASDLVSDIEIAPDQSIWAPSNLGYSRYDANGWIKLALPRRFSADFGPNGVKFQPDASVWVNEVSQLYYSFQSDETRKQADRPFQCRSFHYQPPKTPPETIIRIPSNRISSEGNVQLNWQGRSYMDLHTEEMFTYSYRLDRGTWSPFEARRELVLTDLPQGSHLVEARARDRDGNIDPTPESVAFTVDGVIWQEPWFITLLVCFVIALAMLASLVVRQRIRFLLHIEELKVQFFTNISHELRTPLSVILGPLESLRQSLRQTPHVEPLDMAIRNTKHMSELIDQILEYRRTQSIRFELNCSPVEINEFLHQVTEDVMPLADQKRHRLLVSAPDSSEWVQLDQAKLLRVVENLLTNAIKYTPAGGVIRFSAEVIQPSPDDNRATLLISVADNGIGIPKKRQKDVFQPFYRLREHESSIKGTGIGLALVKEFVEIMEGSILLESPYVHDGVPSQGARFALEIPINRISPAEHQDEADDSSAKTEASPMIARDALFGADAEEDVFPASPRRPRVLLAEDNNDIRSFLKGELSADFEVLEAGDGQSAQNIAKRTSLDLILSDVMMPEMDGYELVRTLKSDLETSHLPIILLTAKRSLDSEMEGLRLGADDYIAKPFNMERLRQKIRNILEDRRKQRERFAKRIFLAHSELSLPSVEEEFLKKVIGIVEDRMQDYDFNADEFAKAVSMSRPSLYRKLKAITGEAPATFIRNMRLDRAAHYLRTGQYNVSQIIENVGFLDHSHFCLCFKKKFRCTPTEFAQRSAPKGA